MRQMTFTGLVEVLGETREAAFDGKALTLTGLRFEEARTIIALVEGMPRSAPWASAAVDEALHDMPVSPARGIAKAEVPSVLATALAGYQAKAEVAVQAALDEANLPEIGGRPEPSGRGRKRGAADPSPPPALATNGTNGHAAPPPAELFQIAPHVPREYPEFSSASDAERDMWVKLAVKELREFRQEAPAYLDDGWKFLLRSAPVGWFQKHLRVTAPSPAASVPKASKAAQQAAEAKAADLARTAVAHRAVNEDVLAQAKSDVASAILAGGSSVQMPIVLPAPVAAEIRAVFGINPGLLAPVVRQALVDRGVEEGIVPPALGGDLDAGWPALCENAPPGWFQHNANVAAARAACAPSPPAVSVPAKANDPAGLAPEGVDPDEDPIAPLPSASPSGIDLAAVQALPTFRDVLGYLADHGVKTQAEMVTVCLALKKDVPTISRVSDVGGRIPRALATLGIELPA